MPCSHFYSPCSDQNPVVSFGAVPTEAVPALKCIAAVGRLPIPIFPVFVLIQGFIQLTPVQ
jgi:hypothetical protein